MLGRRAKRPPPLGGRLTMPGDKSISHRALLLAGIADGSSRLHGLNGGEDVGATLRAVEAFGVSCEDEHDVVEVHGRGWRGLREPRAVVDAGNSGTTLRLGAGLCAGIPGVTILTGDASLRARPMLRVVEPLRAMGATILGRRGGERAPLAIAGGTLVGQEVAPAVASAQVKGAILLAGLRAAGRTRVVEPAASRDHTERMLTALDLQLWRSGTSVEVEGGQSVPGFVARVPGDPSAAAFFVVAATLLEGSDITIDGLCLNPTRTAFLEVLRRMGADLEVHEDHEEIGEPVGSVRVRSAPLTATDIVPEEVPALLDEVPALAVAAACADGVTVFRGVEELRVKESDRLKALEGALRALGGRAEASAGELSVEGVAELGGGEVDARGDHRVAMALAVAGLVARERVRVKGWSSVATSFPGFLETLEQARQGRG